MTDQPPFDGDKLWTDFLESHGEPRGDELLLHAGDLAACDYATALRLRGSPQLPPTEDSRNAWFLGHAVEAYLGKMLYQLGPDWTALHWAEREASLEMTLGGVPLVGHPDWTIARNRHIEVVLDPRTTKSKSLEPSESHMMKTAAYALAMNAPWCAELVIRLGFGKVIEGRWHWFKAEDYRERIETRAKALAALKASAELPPMEPPADMTWLCAKYCSAAACPRNGRVAQDDDSAVPFPVEASLVPALEASIEALR